MNRRQFVAATAGGALTLTFPANGADTKKAIIELRRIQLRNTTDGSVQRTQDYYQAVVPALQRAGVGPVGTFTNIIGEGSPYLLLVTQFPDIVSWNSRVRMLHADKELTEARKVFQAGGPAYTRMEVTLLEAFDKMPRIEPPAAREDNKPRIFELRVYESNNMQTLGRKIQMFEEGEIALFRKLNILPVFFGVAITGRNLPNLTYLVAFDDLAAREKAWGTFVAHPDWKKMSSQPGVSDGEIVSNISNAILRPTPYSMIK